MRIDATRSLPSIRRLCQLPTTCTPDSIRHGGPDSETPGMRSLLPRPSSLATTQHDPPLATTLRFNKHFRSLTSSMSLVLLCLALLFLQAPLETGAAVTIRIPATSQFAPAMHVGRPYFFRLHPSTFSTPTNTTITVTGLPPWISFNPADTTFSSSLIPMVPQLRRALVLLVLINITATEPTGAFATDRFAIPMVEYQPPDRVNPLVFQIEAVMKTLASSENMPVPTLLRPTNARAAVNHPIVYLPAGAPALNLDVKPDTFISAATLDGQLLPPLTYALYDATLLKVPDWVEWNPANLELALKAPSAAAGDQSIGYFTLNLAASNVRNWPGGPVDAVHVKRGNRVPALNPSVPTTTLVALSTTTGARAEPTVRIDTSDWFSDADNDPWTASIDAAPGQVDPGTFSVLPNGTITGVAQRSVVLRIRAVDFVNGTSEAAVDVAIQVNSVAPLKPTDACLAKLEAGGACVEARLPGALSNGSFPAWTFTVPLADMFPQGAPISSIMLAPDAPRWIAWDADKRQLAGTPPNGLSEPVRVALRATDSSGGVAEAVVELALPETATGGTSVSPVDGNGRSTLALTLVGVCAAGFLITLTALVLYYKPFRGGRDGQKSQGAGGEGGEQAALVITKPGSVHSVDDTTHGGPSSAHLQPSSSSNSGGHNGTSSSSGRRQRSSLLSFGSRSRPTSVGPMPERPPYNVQLNDLPPTPAIPQHHMYAGHTPPYDPNASYLSTSEYSTSSLSSSSARVHAQYKGKGKDKIKYGGGGNGIGNDSGVSAHQYSAASSSHHPPPMSPNDSGWMGSPPTLGAHPDYHAAPATLAASPAAHHQQYAVPDAHGAWRSGATNHAEVVVHDPSAAHASASAHDMMHLQSFEASILDCTLLTRKPSNSSDSDAAIGSPEFDPAPTSVTASPASSSITSPGLAPLTSIHASTPGGFHPGPRPRPVNQPPPSAAVTQRRPSVRGELLRKCLARVERDRMAAQHQQHELDGFGRPPPATVAASSALAYAANSNAYSSSSSSNDQSESAYSTSETQSSESPSQTHTSDYSPPATESSSAGDTGTSTSTSQSSTPYSTSTDGIMRRPSQRQHQPIDSARTSIASLSPGHDSFTPNMYMSEILEEDEYDYHAGHTEATSATASGSGGSSSANKAMILTPEERLSSAESVANSLNDLLREYGAQSPTATTVGTASSSPTREEYLTAGSTSPYGMDPGHAAAVEGTGRTSPVLQRVKPRPPALPRLSPNLPMSGPPSLPSPVTPTSMYESHPLHVHFNNDSTIKFGMATGAKPGASASSSGASTPLSPMSPTVMCDAAVVRNLVAYVGIPFQYILTLPPPPAGSRRWSKQGTLGMFTRVKMSLGSQLARSLQYRECSFESNEAAGAPGASRGLYAGANPGAWPASPTSPGIAHDDDGLHASRHHHSRGNSSTKAVKSPSTSVTSGMSVIGGLPCAPSSVEHCYPAGMTAKEAARMTYPNRFQQHLSIVIPTHAGQSSSSSGNRIAQEHPDSYDPLDSPTLSTAATAGSRGPSSGMHRESALGLMFPMAAATEVHLAPPWLAADVDAVKRSGVLRGTPMAGDVGDWTVEVVDKRTMPCPGSSPKVGRSRAPPAHHGGEHNAHEVVIWKAVVRVTAR